MSTGTDSTGIDWVRINRYIELTGETAHSVRHKRRTHWLEGVHYRKAGDGQYWYNLPNINQWLAESEPGVLGGQVRANP